MKGEARKQLSRKVALMILTAAAAFLASAAVLTFYDYPEWAGITALAIPYAVSAWFIMKTVRGDEMQERIQLEALASAYPASILMLITYGMWKREGFDGTEAFGLVAGLPYLIGLVIALRRYR